jgi:hypothetical protein
VPGPRRDRRRRRCKRHANRRAGRSLILWRRLKIGSRTTPVVPDRRRPSRAAGERGSRPRPRNWARLVSHSIGPCVRPSRLSTCAAQIGTSADRGAAATEQRRAGRQVFGLEKQLAERRVREVGGRRASASST